MKKLLLFSLIFLLYSLNIVSSSPGENFTLVIDIEGFESDKGKALIAVFNNKDGYPTKPENAYKKLVSVVKNKKVNLVIPGLPAGTYAVAVHHDENDNEKVDTNFLGIPTENFGASNNAKGFMGPPSFDDAKFELKSNNSIIKIRLQ